MACSRHNCCAALLLAVIILSASLYMRNSTFQSTTESPTLEREMFRLKGELSRLETDKRSLESTVNSLEKMVKGLEEEEKSLQEQLNIALGGGALDSLQDTSETCELKIASLSTQLTDSKELLELWNVTLKECQAKLRKCIP
ncbi:uncharacterized protein LOC135338312 isoform X2 [Halichondria panicea]|uniref:uncharacterized protein LOC135338312 isoform X2 n=1 Tax=Halichondria panicea TaxID=6063 RepID=UPI00312BBEC6